MPVHVHVGLAALQHVLLVRVDGLPVLGRAGSAQGTSCDVAGDRGSLAEGATKRRL